MADISDREVIIRSTTGARYTLTEVRWEVRDEITEKLRVGQSAGETYCAGQRYSWSIATILD
jgi:hypothetical protein